MRKLRQNVGGGGSNNQRVSPLRLGNVVDAVLLRRGRAWILFPPQAGHYLVPGERGKSQRLHKFLRRRSHHHAHLNSLALQRAHQFGCLIRSDSTGDANDDSHVSIVVQARKNGDPKTGLAGDRSTIGRFAEGYRHTGCLHPMFAGHCAPNRDLTCLPNSALTSSAGSESPALQPVAL